MAKVKFLGPIKMEEMEVVVKNLKELKDILNKIDKLKDWLKVSAVAVDGKIVDNLEVKIKKDSEIAIIPPVCGG